MSVQALFGQEPGIGCAAQCVTDAIPSELCRFGNFNSFVFPILATISFCLIQVFRDNPQELVAYGNHKLDINTTLCRDV